MTDLTGVQFRSHIPRKGMKMVRVTSEPIWSPALKLWFVWTECAAWPQQRPWHTQDLPAHLYAQVKDAIHAVEQQEAQT